jgi:hypothetical protein
VEPLIVVGQHLVLAFVVFPQPLVSLVVVLFALVQLFLKRSTAEVSLGNVGVQLDNGSDYRRYKTE